MYYFILFQQLIMFNQYLNFDTIISIIILFYKHIYSIRIGEWLVALDFKIELPRNVYIIAHVQMVDP